MAAEVTRWEAADKPTRAALVAIFRGEGLSPSWWSSRPHDRFSPHSHRYHKVLYCAAGSITIRIEPDGPDIELHPGDRLDIEPGTSHSAMVGADGVTCVEGRALAIQMRAGDVPTPDAFDNV